jgi:segregation and condensation protein A
MSSVLSTLKADHFTEFTALFSLEEGRRGVVVTLMAILELLKQTMIELIQTEPFGAIHVKLIGAER